MKEQQLVEGIVKRHPDGFGFLIADNKEVPDIYIARHDMGGIMTNDRVKVRAYPDRQGKRWRGTPEQIVQRGAETVTGVFHSINEMYGLLIDDSHAWGGNVKVWHRYNGGAKDGDMVVVKITEYPGGGQDFSGKVVQVIGDVEDPLNDIKRVIAQSQIPQEFPKKVLDEAAAFTADVSEEDMKGRKDLRALPFITIDGVTAKDFDDAVYVEQNEKGFALWVAIADVSHYVRRGNAIDEEAYQRGNSTYFPNYVVPMLPEILSNELCSLNPHKPRLAMVAEMRLDFQGEILSSQFYEAVIESHQRVTYGEAQEVVDGQQIFDNDNVISVIQKAADLAKILMAKRMQEGSLDLEIPETEVEVNDAGEPVDILRSERLFAHRLIEEMMLAANIAVARFISSRDIPGLYRIHEPPHEEDIERLERYLHNFGGERKLSGGKLQKKISRALQKFEGHPRAQVLNILTLRTMNQAQYSADNVGHFGLGFEYYTHFTSPIRRYPDLIVHRLLKTLVGAQRSYEAYSEADLVSAGTFLSATEQRSVKAERQLTSIKKARFMQKWLGQEFDGMITSVARFGVFVLLRAFDIDGMVRVDSLGDDFFEFDEEHLTLTGKKSGKAYTIGQFLTVQVVAVDTELGQVTFQLVGEPERESSEPRKATRSNNKKRGQAKKNRRGVRGSRVSKRRGKG